MHAVGIVLAGGRSRRFGAPKTAARFHGRPLLEHAVGLLREVLPDVRIVGSPDAAPTGVPRRPDAEPYAGPLAGLETALGWAAEDGADAVLLLAVDMPLVPPALLRDLLRHPDARIVVPESTGPLAMEPLCARYAVDLVDELAAARRGGARSLRALSSRTGAARLPLEHVRRHGDPEHIFLNVNTPHDLARARSLEAGDASR